MAPLLHRAAINIMVCPITQGDHNYRTQVRFCFGWTDLRQIYSHDVFGPSLWRDWTSRSKVKGQGHQLHFENFTL